MIKDSFCQFKGKRVVLLQGPIGPFFDRLAHDLEDIGAEVFKINFNGGDWIFYTKKAVNFRDHPNEWPYFFEKFVLQNRIDVIFLFGDCRPIHQAAHAVATSLNIEIGVFEEGYIRPNFITLEKYGVNANSKLPNIPDFYLNLPEIELDPIKSVGKAFWFAAMWGMLYNSASVLMSPFYRHYNHHRKLNIWQGLYWIRSLYRKWWYAILQQNILDHLITEKNKKYYLLVLQVHDDSQLLHHSDFYNMDAFISDVVNSFLSNSPEDCDLVIKHHPMDRGFTHYGNLIQAICQSDNHNQRVHYIHDLHLPTLLDHAKGVVVLNSTVGLSALIHSCPVKVCGNAIYDIEGLTFQGSLDSFWVNCETFSLNTTLRKNFLNHLVNNSQVNGNFYKRIDETKFRSGIMWKSKLVNEQL